MAWRRLHTPALATGAAHTLSRRQCPRRLPKNQGYQMSLRSALSAYGETNTSSYLAGPQYLLGTEPHWFIGFFLV